MSPTQLLGPRWSPKELRTFYILLKAHGQQWTKIEERLPIRTNSMIRGLYEMHRGYLSLSEASVEGFCAIMMDYYKNQDELDRASVGETTFDTEEKPITTLNELGMPTLQNESKSTITTPTHPTTPKTRDHALGDTRNKKKRKLDLFLARDDRTPTYLSTSSSPSHRVKKSTQSKLSPIVRRREFLQVNHTLNNKKLLDGRKFDLPWFYWFYSVVDIDFFAHNEFVEYLYRMGLGRITKASRPIWSSIRASMGRPRRLSQVFLAQEKIKLDLHRQRTHQKGVTSNTPGGWTNSCSASLKAGAIVLVHLESPRRFVLGTIENVSLCDRVCKVRLETSVSCVYSLDSIMLMDEPALISQVARQGNGHEQNDLDQSDKYSAFLLVKDLLKRKELLVESLTQMNQQASGMGRPNDRLPHPNMTLFQRQYAWLIVNLDVTNRYLKAALLRLHDISASRMARTLLDSTSFENATVTGGLKSRLKSNTSQLPLTADSSLTLEHMRWAVNFLSLSRKKSSELVATRNAEAPMNSVSPEINDLIANCVALMSVIRRGSSPTIPPLITQKLLERMFDLLEPQFEANMDIYEELRSAAEGLAVMQQHQMCHGNAN